jgi:hypothetical protein
MEILSNNQEIDHLFEDDWDAAKSFYLCKTGICNQCMMKFHHKKSLILPLAPLFKKDFEIDSALLLKSITKWGKPIFFFHYGKTITDKVIIKYTGNENYLPSLETLIPFIKVGKTPANIISPYPLTKVNRKKEHDLVQLSKQYFEPLGFIKLDLHSVDDFHEFAKADKIGLLILPIKDLPDYIQYALSLSEYSKLIPAIFQP